jgi:hypothetical protein
MIVEVTYLRGAPRHLEVSTTCEFASSTMYTEVWGQESQPRVSDSLLYWILVERTHPFILTAISTLLI